MKKVIYVCVLALLALNLACETEEIIVNEQNETYKKTESTETIQGNRPNEEIDYKTERIKTTESINLDVNQSNFSGRDIGEGFDDTGFGGTGIGDTGIGGDDGTIYNGTNFLDNPPDVYGSTVIITFANGTNENRKRELRLSYQLTGELLYYEHCTNDSQKEFWYLSTTRVNVIDGNVTRDGDPPDGPPAFSTLFGSTTTIINTGTNTQVTINEILINANSIDICDY